MKKPLISISKVNSQDVISTSTCTLDPADYIFLFQSDGSLGSDEFHTAGFLNNNYYIYNTTEEAYEKYGGPILMTYCDTKLEKGKWYHLYIDTDTKEGTVDECKDPECHTFLK